MICRKIFCKRSDHSSSIPPRFFDYLICGTVEVQTVNVPGADDVSFRFDFSNLNRSHGRFGQTHACCEVRRHHRFRLSWERAPADQLALGDDLIAFRMYKCFDGDGPRFVPIELEGREEIYVLDCGYVPAWSKCERGLSE